jgi:hypothetical protein
MLIPFYAIARVNALCTSRFSGLSHGPPSFASSGIGFRPLPSDWKTLTMAQTSIRSDIDEPLDIHRYFFAEITFHFMVPIDRFAQFDDLIFAEILHAYRPVDTGFVQNTPRGDTPNTENVG